MYDNSNAQNVIFFYSEEHEKLEIIETKANNVLDKWNVIIE